MLWKMTYRTNYFEQILNKEWMTEGQKVRLYRHHICSFANINFYLISVLGGVERVLKFHFFSVLQYL